MNKYIIPIADISGGEVYFETVMARSLSDCQDKLMRKLSEEYGIEEVTDYRDFINIADSNYDLLIGEIIDIESI